MAVVAVRVDATAVYMEDSQNLWLIIRSSYSSFSEVECDIRVLQTQTHISFCKYHIISGNRLEKIHDPFRHAFLIILRNAS